VATGIGTPSKAEQLHLKAISLMQLPAAAAVVALVAAIPAAGWEGLTLDCGVAAISVVQVGSLLAIASLPPVTSRHRSEC